MPTAPIVCPFCPLCCDDLNIGSDGQSVDVDCRIAREQILAAVWPSPPRLGSQEIDPSAWSLLRESLDLPEQPVVEFNAATIDESKEIESLVSRQQIRIRHQDDAGLQAMARSVVRDGVTAATLGEVGRHADLIWVLGEIDLATPRLRQRLESSDAIVQHSAVASLELLSRLGELIRQQTPLSELADPSQSAAEELYRQIRSSRYTAIVLGRSAFQPGSEVVAAETLLRLIRCWNDWAYPIGDGDDSPLAYAVLVRMEDDQNLRSVLRWRNNDVSPSELSAPHECSIRVGSSPGDPPIPVRLQIGGIDPGNSLAHAYLPASAPGVHFSAVTIRGDGSVTLPLAGWAESQLPSRLEVLRHVLGIDPVAAG